MGGVSQRMQLIKTTALGIKREKNFASKTSKSVYRIQRTKEEVQ
jgi:hypothetical protein